MEYHLSCIISSISAEIFRAPNDTTVFLDNSAEFMCEVNGGLASWRVNETYYNSLPHEIRDDLDTDQEDSDDGAGNEILTLSIPGKAKYNGTKVQCVTGEFGSDPVESENVIMTVQGTCIYMYICRSCIYYDTSHILFCNEGTKVQNPRRVHVYTMYMYIIHCI